MNLFKRHQSDAEIKKDKAEEQRHKREQQDMARRLKLLQYEVDVIQRDFGK